jgi:hypothetical protein
MKARPTHCACGKKQKPCVETEETFGGEYGEGLFFDVPLEAWDEIVCDRCNAVIRERQPCAPVVL